MCGRRGNEKEGVHRVAWAQRGTVPGMLALAGSVIAVGKLPQRTASLISGMTQSMGGGGDSGIGRLGACARARARARSYHQQLQCDPWRDLELWDFLAAVGVAYPVVQVCAHPLQDVGRDGSERDLVFVVLNKLALGTTQANDRHRLEMSRCTPTLPAKHRAGHTAQRGGEAGRRWGGGALLASGQGPTMLRGGCRWPPGTGGMHTPGPLSML